MSTKITIKFVLTGKLGLCYRKSPEYLYALPNPQFLSTLGVVGGGVGALLFALEQSVKASGSEAHPHHQPWSHDGWFSSLDHARYVFSFCMNPYSVFPSQALLGLFFVHSSTC